MLPYAALRCLMQQSERGATRRLAPHAGSRQGGSGHGRGNVVPPSAWHHMRRHGRDAAVMAVAVTARASQQQRRARVTATGRVSKNVSGQAHMSRQQARAKSRQGGHRTSSWGRGSSQQEQPGRVRVRFLAHHGSRATKVPKISPSRRVRDKNEAP